ncbi:MAG: Gfo/Idh/MocA family oxidoreductase [Anaerolineae bacterium]|nr:Gfo/Idh/MocA family oxidoreductase [Anaerolineae bacterium]
MKIKLAILGVGDVAQRDYLPEFDRLRDKIELVAVCGKTETRARAIGEQYHVQWFTDLGQLFARVEFDALVNLSPIQLHRETTLAALKAGKHVYSEKPLALNVADAQMLASQAHARNLKLVCAPCVMLFPQVKQAQSLLKQNAFGEIYSARGYGHGGVPPWIGYTSDPSPFFARGGGPGLDMGVYPLHALTGLLGPAKRVTAFTSRSRASFLVTDGPAEGKTVPIEVDDNWHMLLDFGGARLASVQANNIVQDSRAPQLEVFGLEGTVALNLLDVDAPVEALRAGAWETIKLPRTGREAGPDHLLGIEHLVDCIQYNTAPLLSAAHAVHVLDILEQAEQAARDGCARTVSSTF